MFFLDFYAGLNWLRVEQDGVSKSQGVVLLVTYSCPKLIQSVKKNEL